MFLSFDRMAHEKERLAFVRAFGVGEKGAQCRMEPVAAGIDR